MWFLTNRCLSVIINVVVSFQPNMPLSGFPTQPHNAVYHAYPYSQSRHLQSLPYPAVPGVQTIYPAPVQPNMPQNMYVANGMPGGMGMGMGMPANNGISFAHNNNTFPNRQGVGQQNQCFSFNYMQQNAPPVQMQTNPPSYTMNSEQTSRSAQEGDSSCTGLPQNHQPSSRFVPAAGEDEKELHRTAVFPGFLVLSFLKVLQRGLFRQCYMIQHLILLSKILHQPISISSIFRETSTRISLHNLSNFSRKIHPRTVMVVQELE